MSCLPQSISECFIECTRTTSWPAYLHVPSTREMNRKMEEFLLIVCCRWSVSTSWSFYLVLSDTLRYTNYKVFLFLSRKSLDPTAIAFSLSIMSVLFFGSLSHTQTSMTYRPFTCLFCFVFSIIASNNSYWMSSNNILSHLKMNYGNIRWYSYDDEAKNALQDESFCF